MSHGPPHYSWRRSSKRACAALLGALIFATVPAHAEKLSRGSAIRRAIAYNPQVAAAKARVAQATARQAQVRAARFPEVSLTIGAGPSLQAELVPGTAIQSTRNTYGDLRFKDLSVVFGGTVSVIQPLYTFGKIDKRADATQHEANARRHQAEMTKADIAFEVAKLYESVLFAREAHRFFHDLEHSLASTVAKTAIEVEAERLTEGDLLRLQAAQAYLALGKAQAAAGWAQASAGLVAYLNLPLGTPIEPAEDHLDAIARIKPDTRRFVELAKKHRPELFALKAGQAAYGSLAEAEQAGNLPDFFAAGFASGAYTPGRDRIDTRFAVDPLNHFVPGALVGARWQFQNGRADARASENRAKAAELRHLESWARAGIPAEIKVALEDLKRANRSIDTTKEAVLRAKRWTVQSAADFAMGLGSSTELEDATSAYVRLRLALFRARFDYNVSLAKLAKATGTLTLPTGSPYPTKD